MFILRRLILWLLPIWWIVGLELIKKNSAYFWPTIILLGLYVFTACFVVCKGRLNKIFFNFLILPLFFGAASFVFLIFLVSPTAFHALTVVSAAALYFLLKQYFTYFYFPSKYQPYSLESLSFYLNLLLFYFLFASAFAGLTLLKLDRFISLLVILPIIGLVLYQFFWIHKVDWSAGWLFIAVITLVLLELLLALSYLPTGYFVNAFILTLGAYLMLGISRAFVQNVLNKRTVINYVTVAACLAFIVMITAKWS